jgi:hypothetical protein
MAEFYVYKDAVTHNADKAMSNPTGFSRCARGTLDVATVAYLHT